MDSAEALIKKALSEGIIKDRELNFVPEAIPVINGGVKMFYDIVREYREQEDEIPAGLVHHICCYLFAKAVEAVIVWGQTKDGKFSIYYLPKDMANLTPNPEIPEKYHSVVLESMKYGELLFLAHKDFIESHLIPNSIDYDIMEEIHKTFLWISRIGMSHALEKEYHLLIKKKNNRFWEFLSGKK